MPTRALKNDTTLANCRRDFVYDFVSRFVSTQQASFRVCALVFLVSMTFRVGLMVASRGYQDPEGTEVIFIAQSLAHKGEFGNAYGGDSGPTAHASPLYPFLISFIYRVTHSDLQAEISRQIFSSVLASAQYALMPVASVMLGMPAGVGILAGLLGALIPVNYWSEVKGTFEASCAGLALMGLFLCFGRIWRDGRFSLAAAIGTGLVGGLAMLVSASLAPVLGALLLCCVCTPKVDTRWRVLYPLVIGLVSSVVVTPWMARNYLRLGSPVLRSSFGMVLSVAQNDKAHAVYEDDEASGLWESMHPHSSKSEWIRLQAMGEAQYNAAKLSEALAWMTGHPKAFMRLTAQRVFYFWFPRMKRWFQSAFLDILTLCAIAGLWRLIHSRNIAAWGLLSILLSYPLAYYLVHAFGRYRYPVHWILILLGATWICSLMNARQPVRADRTIHALAKAATNQA